MCAICGSVSLAWAKAAPDISPNAATAVINLESIVDPPLDAAGAVWTKVGCERAAEVPGYLHRRRTTSSVMRSQRRPSKGNVLVSAGPSCLSRASRNRARAQQPGLHHLGLQAEQVRGFLNRHAFDQARDEHRAKAVRKLVDRAFEHRPDFTLRHYSLRILAGGETGKSMISACERFSP